MINLEGIKMNVIETANNGVVNHETVFNFRQKGNVVSAKYAGGLVKNGFLAGRLINNQLSFKYAQEHADNNIVGGASVCDLRRLSNGKLQLIEIFDWDQGIGKNIFQELE